MLGLGVNVERGIGSVIPIQATRIRGAGTATARPRSAWSTPPATSKRSWTRAAGSRPPRSSTAPSGSASIPSRCSSPSTSTSWAARPARTARRPGAAIALALASLLSGRPFRRDVAVTGEIDTQGRITGVGGLDVKLETAANAGCKTVIIPRDNLHGPGGIERFPEALKRELQILTFEEWASPHEPFDYARHVLQVVAVDHILEAQQIACIDNDELKAVEERFVEHAETVAASLAARRGERQSCPVAVLVKDVSELAETHFMSTLCEHCSGCHLLIPREGQQTLLGRFPHLAPCVKPLDFDASSGNLAQALESLIEAQPKSGAPARLAVIAPFFALKDAALGPDRRERSIAGRVAVREQLRRAGREAEGLEAVAESDLLPAPDGGRRGDRELSFRDPSRGRLRGRSLAHSREVPARPQARRGDPQPLPRRMASDRRDGAS